MRGNTETPRRRTASIQVDAKGACLIGSGDTVMLGKIALASFLVALPAIALADVRVDLDRHKDFSKYRTFTVELGTLVRPDGTIDEHNTLAENRIRDAVTRELAARGLEPTDSTSADLTVRVSGRDSDRVSSSAPAGPPLGLRVQALGVLEPLQVWVLGSALL